MVDREGGRGVETGLVVLGGSGEDELLDPGPEELLFDVVEEEGAVAAARVKGVDERPRAAGGVAARQAQGHGPHLSIAHRHAQL